MPQMGPRRKAAASDKRSKNVPSTTAVARKKEEPSLPLELQQLMLQQFTLAFPFADATDLKDVVQVVKGHLYNRNFADAFGKPEHLEAYAVRWSASRALGYADLLVTLDLPATQLVFDSPEPNREESKPVNVICIGGGAGAEVAALTAVIGRRSRIPIEITAVDVADWSHVLSKLETALTTAPPLSAYASEAAKAANKAFVERETLQLKFMQRDILADWDATLRETVHSTELVTVMFTLNELFSASIPRTTKMLLELTENMRIGSHLLVVDSPGSYSEITLGKQAEGEDTERRTKRYPMQWLLDHTLGEVAAGSWEKVLGDEGRWFRVGQGVGARYTIELENMRMQVHLYRRVETK